MLCEMCGKTDNLISACIEGINLQVCSNCSKYGRIDDRQENKGYGHSSNRQERPEAKVVDNLSQLLAQKRTELGLTTVELAKLLNQRESLVSKWQSGTLKPNLEVAQKLSKKLNLRLVETEESQNNNAIILIKSSKNKSNELTIGDVINKSLFQRRAS